MIHEIHYLKFTENTPCFRPRHVCYNKCMIQEEMEEGRKKDLVHVHLWKPIDEHDGSDNDLLFDQDVELTGEYDDHYQYSVSFENGQTLEIRVPK